MDHVTTPNQDSPVHPIQNAGEEVLDLAFQFSNTPNAILAQCGVAERVLFK
ncbi:hypothetical protein PISMIDRAFT_13442 [Pisolithus microcarpus 441]|uniref:Uncharacterized protein n=1 Tax=Pisolithus microcarpus 441 TaxID=765257 RepID=A0A0C9Y500_9AGAM|nr:hypothetical protein PISMIDRAFT_13442 [Pisolithus microcarpus 441]